MTEQEAIKEKEGEILEKGWFEDVPLPAKFRKQRPAFSKMLTEFESIWNGDQGHINVAKHRTDLNDDELRPVHYEPCQTAVTERQFTVDDIS